jgi:hypothetical protein
MVPIVLLYASVDPVDTYTSINSKKKKKMGAHSKLKNKKN